MAVTITDSLIARVVAGFEPGEISVISGDPGTISYPFVSVDHLRWTKRAYNSKGTYEQEEVFQVTISAYDPKEAETLGARAEETLKPVRDPSNAKLVFDDGYEVNRLPGSGRKWKQDGAGPDNLTLFYYAFDVAVTTGRVY